jgi:bifunctional ADP-heptose synthase (sugar kinase/adenylyltransferase)
VVGIGPDVDMKPYKGEGRPILNEAVRLKMTISVKPVDYAFILPSFLGLDTPLAVVSQVLDELKPDIYVINDDAFDIPYRKNMVKKTKTELVILNRWCPPEFDQISTTKLINKIKNSNFQN